MWTSHTATSGVGTFFRYIPAALVLTLCSSDCTTDEARVRSFATQGAASVALVLWHRWVSSALGQQLREVIVLNFVYVKYGTDKNPWRWCAGTALNNLVELWCFILLLSLSWVVKTCVRKRRLLLSISFEGLLKV